ncbi:hypothetical protein ACRALDRAFT_209505 [Sodiomyces alcalophilus JCM 7366]|uniref:uncharacterized protein n=1 Tax=Sodiomyces alcalophilus JCM 7366 TaxID=591952 RepID=UPI0039B465FB
MRFHVPVNPSPFKVRFLLIHIESAEKGFLPVTSEHVKSTGGTVFNHERRLSFASTAGHLARQKKTKEDENADSRPDDPPRDTLKPAEFLKRKQRLRMFARCTEPQPGAAAKHLLITVSSPSNCSQRPNFQPPCTVLVEPVSLGSPSLPEIGHTVVQGNFSMWKDVTIIPSSASFYERTSTHDAHWCNGCESSQFSFRLKGQLFDPPRGRFAERQ